MTGTFVIDSVCLEVDVQALDDLREFYARSLGLACVVDAGNRLQLDVGPARMGFLGVEHKRRPFHHFALLVSADRFLAALDWLATTADLLPGPGRSEPIIDFDFWDARACYAFDPAGNVLELIAHDCSGVRNSRGRFEANELLGISEVGLVVLDRQDAVRRLAAPGLEMWDGELSQPEGLVFVGRKANTLILSPRGRAWLPTQVGAEPNASTTIVRAEQRHLVRVANGQLSTQPVLDKRAGDTSHATSDGGHSDRARRLGRAT